MAATQLNVRKGMRLYLNKIHELVNVSHKCPHFPGQWGYFNKEIALLN